MTPPFIRVLAVDRRFVRADAFLLIEHRVVWTDHGESFPGVVARVEHSAIVVGVGVQTDRPAFAGEPERQVAEQIEIERFLR